MGIDLSDSEVRTLVRLIERDRRERLSIDRDRDSLLEKLRYYMVPEGPHPVHIHDWRTFKNLKQCICVTEPRCYTNRHPYGMFDDCGEHE